MSEMGLFFPRLKRPNKNRPILLYEGLISKSRNLNAFLESPINGLKRLIGSGPDRDELRCKYPMAEFIFPLSWDRLSEAYAQSDVFVYPCRSNHFEECVVWALASGIPVAGFPTDVMMRVIDCAQVGCYDANLLVAINRAMKYCDPKECVRRSQELYNP